MISFGLASRTPPAVISISRSFISLFNADFSITRSGPSEACPTALPQAENGKAGFQIDPDSPPADEDILVLAVPVEAGAARVDLTALADPAVTRGGADWFANHLDPDATTTRSFSTKPAPLLMIRQARAGPPHAKGR